MSGKTLDENNRGLGPMQAHADHGEHDMNTPRPYRNAPDSLMGFRKNGQNRGYDESNYKHEQKVRVHFNDGGGSHDDAIKGLNKPHALERARRNWPAASKIEPLD